MSSTKSDETIFDAKKVVQAAKGNVGYYKTLTWQERLLVANYLNSIAYNYPENNPPRLDKTFFRAWNMEEENRYYNTL